MEIVEHLKTQQKRAHDNHGAQEQDDEGSLPSRGCTGLRTVSGVERFESEAGLAGVTGSAGKRGSHANGITSVMLEDSGEGISDS